MKDFIEMGTLTAELAVRLEGYVVERKNILICGGTSSGKSTLANVLTEYIPNHERIVLIEDTAELQIQKENVVRFEARREQGGLPAVTIRDLLKATLRHRPDRIILGEIRGGEAFDLLQLLNTGTAARFRRSMATPPPRGLSRFATCVLQSGVEIGQEFGLFRRFWSCASSVPRQTATSSTLSIHKPHPETRKPTTDDLVGFREPRGYMETPRSR
jgi:pilus assembly protein CpaF